MSLTIQSLILTMRVRDRCKVDESIDRDYLGLLAGVSLELGCPFPGHSILYKQQHSNMHIRALMYR